MKKIICIILTIILVLSLAVTSFALAKDNKTVYISHEDEISMFYLSDEYNSNYKYTFILNSDIETRAICYNCGRPNMGIATQYDEVDIKTMTYPYIYMWDTVVFYDVNKVERCTACSYSTIIETIGTRLKVMCFGSGTEYEAEEGNTMEDGYDPHECLSTYM